MRHRPLSPSSLKDKKPRDFTKFRKRMMNSGTYQQDIKPPIMVQPECIKCKRILADHPSYPRTNYPVYGTECVYPFVDKYT